MADEVKIPKCARCDCTYVTTKRPKCLCSLCADFRQHRNPDTGNLVTGAGICIVCCFENYGKKRKLHTLANAGIFLCYACGAGYYLDRKCPCCEESFLCNGCCQNYQLHKLCCGTNRIVFGNNGLTFVNPSLVSMETPNGFKFLDREQSLKVLTKTAPASWLDLKGFSKNSSRRYAAVELEIINYKDAKELNKTLGTWNCSVVHDGSMMREAANRGIYYPSDRSFEINTSPACGNSLYNQLSEICDGLNKAEAKVTTGCAVHVHVDCRDFTYQEIQRLTKAYYHIEEALFAAVHWTRYINDFCKRCGSDYYKKFILGVKSDTKGLKSALIKGVYGDITNNSGKTYHATRADHYGRIPGSQRRNENRYTALNLHSYFLRGSVESRIHHGSTDFEEIYGWAKLQVDLFDSILKISESKLNKVLEVSPAEIEEARELIHTDKFKLERSIDASKIALGVVVLRSLLPEESFNTLLKKIETNSRDLKIATGYVLPCQKNDPEVAKPVDVPVPEPRVGQLNAREVQALEAAMDRFHIEPPPAARGQMGGRIVMADFEFGAGLRRR